MYDNPGSFNFSLKMFEGDNGNSSNGNGSNNKQKKNGPFHNDQKPHSFQKKKKKSSGDDNHSVTATTSKNRTPLPPNQEKKVNNKKAARRKREQLEILENSRKNSSGTPLSSVSDTRVMLDEMNLITNDGHDSGFTSDSDAFMALDEYKELPTDALILNTETVEKIIEQIGTDIESEVETIGDPENDSDSDEFGDGEGLNAGVQRYFIENSGPKCFNCGESGHVLRDCPATSTVPCNLCGQIGHSRFNCPQEVCYNCSRPGHQSKACPARRKRRVYDDDLCNRCGQPGHLAKECSMAWRSYVFCRDLPRSHSNFLEELRRLRKRCYNCASISHFGDDCPNRRRPNYSVFHIPDFDYLDRVILRIKASAKSKTVEVAAAPSSVEKKEPNAKQKQADNFKKIVSNSNTGSNKNNKDNIVKINDKNRHHNAQNTHHNAQNTHHKQTFEDHNDFILADFDNDDDSNNHIGNNRDQEKSVNRKVFLQSRGVNDSERDEIKKPVPFVHYEGNKVRVNEYKDGDEGDNFKKGSSGNKNSGGKPRYRGGYK